MALINWSESYSVKVSKFDNQHKELVNLINNMNSAMSSGKGKDVLEPTLKKLVDYTVKHFTDEEQEMKRTNYPGFVSHKYEHDKLTKTAKDLYDKVKNGQTVLSMDVISFLKDWLTEHIVKVDKKYADHLVAKGVR